MGTLGRRSSDGSSVASFWGTGYWPVVPSPGLRAPCANDDRTLACGCVFCLGPPRFRFSASVELPFAEHRDDRLCRAVLGADISRRALPNAANRAGGLAAVALAVFVGVGVIKQRVLFTSNEGGTIIDADAIVDY